MNWIDIKGPINADTVYCDNELMARDSNFELPEVTPKTSEYPAMGTMEIPTLAQIENMEMKINKIGVDMGLAKMNKFKANNYEIRFVQEAITADGTARYMQCKAFITAIPKGLPAVSGEVGSPTEAEGTYTCTSYKLIADGEVLWDINRLTGKMEIADVDYAESITSFL